MGKKRKRPTKLLDGETSVPCKRRKDSGGGRAVSIHEHPVLSRYYPRLVTLRQYLLEQLPASSKARRRRITGLGRDPKAKTDHSLGQSDPDSGDNVRQIVDLLDSTLVGILQQPSPAITQDRQRDFAAFTQSQERSILCTDTGPTSAQSEVRRCLKRTRMQNSYPRTICNLPSSAVLIGQQIVDFVIATLLNRNNFVDRKCQHVLANGFHRATARQVVDRDVGALAYNIPGVVSRFPNHHATTLKQAPWTDVLGLLGLNGDDIMIRLLLDCGVFPCIDQKKATFYQLSGIHLSELDPIDAVLPNTEGSRVESRPSLSLTRSEKTTTVKKPPDATAVLHTPNTIIFVRRRMLYGRPALNARGDVRFGLRHIHVLNRFPSRDDRSHTVHVMKYIFPRQFGLHNAFTSSVDSRETAQPFKDYTSREEEIVRHGDLYRKNHRSGKNDTKLPKRLRGRALQLVEQLQKRNHTCSYTELLEHYCPIDETGPPKFSRQFSQPHSNLSQQFVTQDRLHSQSSKVTKEPPCSTSVVGENEASVQTAGDNQPRSGAGPKISLTDHATPTSSVSAFCRATLQRLIPAEFFGLGVEGASNRRTVMKYVDRFIRISRFESLSLHEVCKGIKITNLKWLETPGCQFQHSHKISLSDLRKRTEILHEFIYYIFDSLLIPLVRSNFYVTETQVHRNRLFYFRHDAWRRLIENPMAEMKISMFDEIKRDNAHRILGRKSLTYSTVRLLPKAVGTRPIINLRRRVMKKNFLGPSINSMVTPILNMLTYEKMQNPGLLGSSMFSVGDMYPRLKAFKDRWTRAHRPGERPKQLYFVKLDIQSCFDTIPQRKLIALVESLVSDPVYHVTKHVEIRPAERYRNSVGFDPLPPGKPVRKFVSKATGARDLFNTSACRESAAATVKRNTVYVDTATAKNHRAETLLDLLDEHVCNNLVKIGKKYFRQRNGIPQGSVLSSLLCNFFYGELERTVLGFLRSDDALLLRLIDDFLLITSAPDLARRFVQVMVDGQPDYGISINPSKSLVNFEITAANGTKIPRLVGSTLFPYCGNLIDTHTLDLRKDRDHGQAHVADTLTVESNRVPGRAFHRKVLASFRMQTHARFLDTQYNRPSVVLLGIYTNFVETAIKMYRYCKALRPRCRPSARLLLGTIRDLIQFAHHVVQSTRGGLTTQPPSSTAAKADPAPTTSRLRCSVTSSQIHHLGAAAFHHVLARKQTQFPTVLRFLLQIQKSHLPKTDRQLLQLRTVIREGNRIFDHWRY